MNVLDVKSKKCKRCLTQQNDCIVCKFDSLETCD